MDQTLVLRAAIGAVGPCAPIWAGQNATARLRLDPVRVEPPYTAFGRMVRDLEFDLSEMPVVTFAQARLAGRPLVLLPVPASCRFHHASILCREDSDIRGPADLAGRRVAARSWPQTNGVWVRGILMREYGLQLDSVTWITQEGPHLRDKTDPPWVQRDSSGRSLLAMLADGSVDAITGVAGVPPGTRPVLPDAAGAAAAWFARTGVVPVNHLIALPRALVDRDPCLPVELMALFARTADLARAMPRKAPEPGQPAIDLPWTVGLQANRASIQMLLDFATEQGLLPGPVLAQNLFDPDPAGIEVPAA